MKYISLVFLILFSCKSESNNPTNTEKVPSKFPVELNKVFMAHGGLDNWNKINTLAYSLNNERHTIDLASRKTKITSPNYELGFNGKKVWLQKKDSTSFKQDPTFYYNLYFYFYAMPFVLGDKGISYSNTPPLVFENLSYPGIKISYQNNIGNSPEDNYYLYYNPDTYKMEWLSYSVTYFTQKTSDKRNLIRYNDWEFTRALLLPKSITWYQSDSQGNPVKPSKSQAIFSDIVLEKTSLKPDFFEPQSEVFGEMKK